MAPIGTRDRAKDFTVTTEQLGISSADVILCQEAALPVLWPVIWNIIETNYSGGVVEFFTEETLLASCITGGYDVWLALDKGNIEGVAICIRLTYPKKNFYKILWAGGKLKRFWLGGLQKIEAYAAVTGCAELNFEGRTGWMGALKVLGYTRVPVVKLAKDLRTKLH